MPNLPEPESAAAHWLAERAATHGDTVFVARSDSRLARLRAMCAGFCAGRVDLLVLPPWDVLPYDGIAPSPGIVGERTAALATLLRGSGRPRLLLTSAEAVLQRVPPRSAWAEPPLALAPGDAFDAEELRAALGAGGYHLGEQVDDPGEVAFRGQVLDVFPAASPFPVRIEHEEGRIAAIHRFDPATQRTLQPVDGVQLHPCVEFPLDPEEAEQSIGGDEAVLALPSGRLVPVSDYLEGFAAVLDPEVPERLEALREQAEDAYQSGRRLRRTSAAKGVLPRPGALFQTAEAVLDAFGSPVPMQPEAAGEPNSRSVAELVRRAKAASGHVVVAAPGDAEKLARSLAKRGLEAHAASGWEDALAHPVSCLDLDIDAGFAAGELLVLQAGPLVRGPATAASLAGAPGTARLGDVVVHIDRGAARVSGLKRVDDEERIALAFADGSELLAAPAELDRVWRYGTEGTLDRLGGEAWTRQRAEIEAEIADVAARLAEQARARAARSGPAMDPERAAYDRLARRFPFALSADQQAAVDAVIADLRRGSPPMDRLLCGDVGFGKTEIALRAAAAVALSGYQVAVAAPTTVLARQHLETFRRRFAGTGIAVEGLMGSGPETRAVRKGLADGSVGIVIGTQALAAASVRFQKLGLAVIDEEQRFGEAQKQVLAGNAPHLLVMTATPIPRTLQSALVGLREVSVLATPPVNRQPTRTVVLPFEPALVRDALLREAGRDGQSFYVCPRIADLKAAAERLAELVPELDVVQAHGRMKPEALEAAVTGFSEGRGDVLLATNIIESGLDIPRANTIVVTGAERFGLAQLHQMRGRVGRGARRGAAFMMTDPGRRMAAPTKARLAAIAALGSLGAGAAISAADLDQRGAGELFGNVQAGHVSALGTELYQHMLLQAVRQEGGEPPAPAAAEVHLPAPGRIPEEMVPEPDLRLSLYWRLSRLDDVAAIAEFAEELDDRFGDADPALERLLAAARLRGLCTARGVARLDVGPKGAAFAPREPEAAGDLAESLGGTVREGRVILAMQPGTAALDGLVERLSG